MTEHHAPASLPDKAGTDELLYRSLRSIYHFERLLVERFGLGFEEIYLLQLLRRRTTARIGVIAAVLGVQVFTATRLIQRLETAGLVVKRRSENDGRMMMVYLEAAGEKLVADIEASNFELIVGAASTLSSAEQQAFVQVASKIDTVLGVADRVAREP